MKARRVFRDRSPVRNPWRSDDLETMEKAFAHDRRRPEHYEGHGPLIEPLTSEQIRLLWDPPRGYVPPAPESMGLLG